MLKKIFVTILGVIALYFIILFILKTFFFPRKFQQEVEKAASNYSIDPYIIYSVIKQESNFNKHAESKKGAKRVNANTNYYCR